MLKYNTLYKPVLAMTLIAAAMSAGAETASTSASVTVQNTFTLSKVADLSFGTLRVTQDIDGTTDALTSGAGVRLLADGSGSTEISAVVSAGSPTSQVSVITPGSPAEFSISGAAANTALSLVINTAEELEALSDSTATFDLTFAASDYRVVNSDTTEVPYNGINLVTDAAGLVGFKMGGSLVVIETIDGVDDGDYIATFDVEVNY